MNKIKLGLSALTLIVALSFVIYAQAEVKKATLINDNGQKIVVAVNSAMAQYYFGQGYVLMTDNLGSLSSPNIASNYLSVNGDTTYHITGDLKDATTTIVSLVNPFGILATSTVDLVRIDVRTAATSTYSLSCGASTGYSTADTNSLLDTAADGVATSTVGILENGLTAALGGIADAGTVVKIALTPTYPYFTCRVTSLYPGAFTEVTNTFAGKFTVRVHKQR